MRNSAAPDYAPDTAPDQHVRPRAAAILEAQRYHVVTSPALE